MSLFLIADIETTGFSPAVETILEFSYILFDGKKRAVVDSGVMFFYQEGQKDSHPEAFKVHGITKDFLKQYEGDYWTNMQKLFKLMTKANFVGFNSKKFDVPFTQEFLRRHGYGDVLVNNADLDLMNIYHSVYGRVKLTKLIELLKIEHAVITVLQNHYFKGYTFKEQAHNAAYDVIETMMAFTEAIERGLIDERLL